MLSDAEDVYKRQQVFRLYGRDHAEFSDPVKVCIVNELEMFDSVAAFVFAVLVYRCFYVVERISGRSVSACVQLYGKSALMCFRNCPADGVEVAELFAFVARFVSVVVEDECCMRSDDSVQELFYMVDPELFRRIFFAAFNYCIQVSCEIRRSMYPCLLYTSRCV